VRIGIAKPRRGAGGGTTMALNLAVGLRERGHELFVMAHPRALIRQRAHELGIPVDPVLFGGDIRPLPRALSWLALRRRRPDVLLVNVARPPDLDYCAGPALRLGIPVVARRGLAGELRLTDTQRALFRRVRWIAVSQAIGRELEQALPGEEPPTVIPNGTDLDRIEAEPAADLGLPDGALAIGFVGRLHLEKGIAELGAAWPGVADAMPHAHLLIAGRGEHEATLRQALAGAPRVHWLGFRRDAVAVQKALDLLVLPTHREGFPNVIVEAMAAGVPVLSTAVDGPIEAVVDDVTGRLIPPRDPHALTEAMIALARDEAARKRMGAAGKQQAAERFDWTRVLDDYETALARAAEAGPLG